MSTAHSASEASPTHVDEAAPVDRAVPVAGSSVPDGVVAAAAGSSGDVGQLAEPRGEPQSISPDHLHVGSTQPVPVKACDGQATSVADVSVHIDVESKTAAASGPESKQPAHIPKPPPSSNMRPDYHAHAGANDLSKSQIAKAVVDTLVLAWCFLLPIIAAYLREKVGSWRKHDNPWRTWAWLTCTGAHTGPSLRHNIMHLHHSGHECECNHYTLHRPGNHNVHWRDVFGSVFKLRPRVLAGSAYLLILLPNQVVTVNRRVFKPLPRGWRVLIGLIPIVVVFEVR